MTFLEYLQNLDWRLKTYCRKFTVDATEEEIVRHVSWALGLSFLAMPLIVAALWPAIPFQRVSFDLGLVGCLIAWLLSSKQPGSYTDCLEHSPPIADSDPSEKT